MESLNKKELGEVYAISCVERYILAYLKKMEIDISLLYYNSYLSINHILSDFVLKNVSYVNYDVIPRIHDIAIESKVLNLYSELDSELSFMEDGVHEYLLEMKPEVYKQLYEKESWREDHFFYAKKYIDGTYLFLNDNPLQEKLIDVIEMKRLYNQRYLAFNCTGNQLDKDAALKKLSIQYEIESNFEKCMMGQIKYNVLRDILCMLRISRKRVSDFIGLWISPPIEWVDHVNRIFSKIEYSRVRQKYDPNIFTNEIDTFLRDEDEIGKYLQIINGRQN